MFNTRVFASRTAGVTSVTVIGDLEWSTHQARIVDKYPGGRVVYSRDPGCSQVFVEEISKTTSDFGFMFVPWIGHVNIPVQFHDHVVVLVNGEPVSQTE